MVDNYVQSMGQVMTRIFVIQESTENWVGSLDQRVLGLKPTYVMVLTNLNLTVIDSKGGSFLFLVGEWEKENSEREVGVTY